MGRELDDKGKTPIGQEPSLSFSLPMGEMMTPTPGVERRVGEEVETSEDRGKETEPDGVRSDVPY